MLQFGMRLLKNYVSALLMTALGCSISLAEPITLHPDNPHYFLWKGEPTILITSGEHYGALLNLDFDYRRYFDELAAHSLKFNGRHPL